MRPSARPAAANANATRQRPSPSEMQARIDALEAELAEARAQQTATAEVLRVINSSPGDLAPVFDAMLDKAMRLCEAAFGVFVTVDGDHFRLAAERHVPRAFLDYVASTPTQIDPRSLLGDAIIKRRIVHTLDDAESDAYRERVPLAVAAVDFGGIRTVLHVPLIKDEQAVGVLIVFRQEVHPFSDKQIALLQNFADQAVIAMENARLLTETREALDQQTATAEVLEVINSSPGDLGPVFDAMLDKALDLCGAAFGNLWTFDGERFRAAALRRVPEAYVDILSREAVPPRLGTVLGHIAAGKAFAQIPDAASEDAYMSTDARTLVELGGGRTVVGVPLRKETSLVGAITIFRQEVKPFTEQQIEVLQNFAAQAVIAMENARLLTETREALEQQTATAQVLGVINLSPGLLYTSPSPRD